MQTVPGPSPCLFSRSLTKRTSQPFLLHGVPGVTATVGSSSSSAGGLGCRGSGSTCDDTRGRAADVVEYVSFPSVDDSATVNVVVDDGLGSGALGASDE